MRIVLGVALVALLACPTSAAEGDAEKVVRGLRDCVAIPETTGDFTIGVKLTIDGGKLRRAEVTSALPDDATGERLGAAIIRGATRCQPYAGIHGVIDLELTDEMLMGLP